MPILFFLITFLFSHSLYCQTIEQLSRRVDAHLLIGDEKRAIFEAKRNFEQFPDEELSFTMLIRAYAKNGDEDEMMKIWDLFLKKFPDRAKDRKILEVMSLGILKKGCEADSLNARLIGFLAIAKSEVPDAVSVILKGLNDTNAHIRCLNVELAAVYRDGPLVDEIVKMFHIEQHTEVKNALYRAIAKLQLTTLLPDLMQRLEKRGKMSASEMKEIITTIAAIKESATRDELKALIDSKRSWQAILACELITHWNLESESDLLFALLQDGSREVKVEAIKTLGHLRKGDVALLQKICFDEDPLIGITASWAYTFLDSTKIEEMFSHWLDNDSRRIRLSGASALMKHGKSGAFLAKKYIEKSDDPFLRLNLAMQLLKLRIDVEKNGEIVFDFLRTSKEKLMWDKSHFPFITVSNLSHSPSIENRPEAMNQMVRLEILNLLSIVEYKQAQEAIREFLKETRWEIAGSAAENLLQEGDDSAIILVKNLLNDPDIHLQTQAALLLAMWGKDSASVTKLIELYEGADRPLKIKILEAIGFVGDESSIPFLIERLKEPSKTLRLVGACILMQTLYH